MHQATARAALLPIGVPSSSPRTVSIKSRDGVNSFPRILPSFHTRFLYALIAKM